MLFGIKGKYNNINICKTNTLFFIYDIFVHISKSRPPFSFLPADIYHKFSHTLYIEKLNFEGAAPYFFGSIKWYCKLNNWVVQSTPLPHHTHVYTILSMKRFCFLSVPSPMYFQKRCYVPALHHVRPSITTGNEVTYCFC